MKHIYVITGGTMVHVSPHFSLCAPAYGHVGSEIYQRLQSIIHAENGRKNIDVYLVKTKMAGVNADQTVQHLQTLGVHSQIETNDDMEKLVWQLLAEDETAGMIMAAAICDFAPVKLTGFADDSAIHLTSFGKDTKRLHHAHSLQLHLQPSDKIIDRIKEVRPDICLGTFKTTAGASQAALIAKASHNLQRSRSDFVFANDIRNYENLVVSSSGEQLRGEDRSSTIDLFCHAFMRRI